MHKRVRIDTVGACLQGGHVGCFLGKDDRELLDRVSDWLVGDLRDCLEQMFEADIFERRIDPDDDAVHIGRLAGWHDDGLTGVRIYGCGLSRCHHIRIDQEVDSFLVRIAFDGLFRKE